MAGEQFVLVIFQILISFISAARLFIVLVVAGARRDGRGSTPFPLGALVLARFFVFRSRGRQVVEVGWMREMIDQSRVGGGEVLDTVFEQFLPSELRAHPAPLHFSPALVAAVVALDRLGCICIIFAVGVVCSLLCRRLISLPFVRLCHDLLRRSCNNALGRMEVHSCAPLLFLLLLLLPRVVCAPSWIVACRNRKPPG
jgi:hypothetical protein